MPATPSTQSGGATRAPLMRRESSQNSHTSTKHGVQSPGSGEVPLHRPVKPARHAKVVLPRNHSSARNLQKLQRQAQQQQTQGLAPGHAQGVTFEDGKGRTVRQRSHEGDTAIRLPGSLDESQPVAPPMRRNLTAYQLPRTSSHTKLKKNLSHGHLTRLAGSSKNLAALNSPRGPPSPGLKGKKKRPKSADFGTVERDLHEQEVELAQQRHEEERENRGGAKKVGFAVGSSGDDGEEDVPQMEGSGLQEDDWTDQSASASPYSTRQNTANNSRRASMNFEKPPDKAPVEQANGQVQRLQNGTAGLGSPLKQHQEKEVDAPQREDDGGEESDEPPSPRSMPHVMKRHEAEEEVASTETTPVQPPQPRPKVTFNPTKVDRSAFTQRLLSRGSMNSHSPAPALVTNAHAHVEAHSPNGTPTPSLRSSVSNLEESTSSTHENGHNNPSDPDNSEELVSRFIPSASHPSTNSGTTTAVSTPKTSGFHTPDSHGHTAIKTPPHLRNKPITFTPTSADENDLREHDDRPDAEDDHSNGTTPPISSGANTPSLLLARSRTELRMLTEKAMADREDAARAHPPLPPHVFDRRNETLKSWLRGDGNSAYRYGGAGAGVTGEDLFQGRFRAADTELRVVQRFRDPVGESLDRMRRGRKASGSGLLAVPGQVSQRSDATGGAKMPTSKSAVQLSKQVQGERLGASKLSTSASPPPGTASSMTAAASPSVLTKSAPAKSAITNSKSATQLRREPSRRSKVTFSQPDDETMEADDASVRSRQVSGAGDGRRPMGAETIARRMWEKGMAGGRSVSAESA